MVDSTQPSIQDLFVNFQKIIQESLSTDDYQTVSPFIDALQKEIYSTDEPNPQQVMVLSNQIEDLLEALLLTSNKG